MPQPAAPASDADWLDDLDSGPPSQPAPPTKRAAPPAAPPRAPSGTASQVSNRRPAAPAANPRPAPATNPRPAPATPKPAAAAAPRAPSPPAKPVESVFDLGDLDLDQTFDLPPPAAAPAGPTLANRRPVAPSKSVRRKPSALSSGAWQGWALGGYALVLLPLAVAAASGSVAAASASEWIRFLVAQIALGWVVVGLVRGGWAILGAVLGGAYGIGVVCLLAAPTVSSPSDAGGALVLGGLGVAIGFLGLWIAAYRRKHDCGTFMAGQLITVTFILGLVAGGAAAIGRPKASDIDEAQQMAEQDRLFGVRPREVPAGFAAPTHGAAAEEVQEIIRRARERLPSNRGQSNAPMQQNLGQPETADLPESAAPAPRPRPGGSSLPF